MSTLTIETTYLAIDRQTSILKLRRSDLHKVPNLRSGHIEHLRLSGGGFDDKRWRRSAQKDGVKPVEVLNHPQGPFRDRIRLIAAFDEIGIGNLQETKL